MTTPFHAGGPLFYSHDRLYVERQGDKDGLSWLVHPRDTIDLLMIAPRQQGKTSWIYRLMRNPDMVNFEFAYADMQNADCTTEETWYLDLWHELRLSPFIEASLEGKQTPTCARDCYDQMNVLARLAFESGKRLVIVLDELGVIKQANSEAWTSRFFSTLRKIQNARLHQELRCLSFVFIGTFNPSDLIRNPDVSPFNISKSVNLADFTREQTRRLLAIGNWSEPMTIQIADRIHDWTDGQPYITQALADQLHMNCDLPDVDKEAKEFLHNDKAHLPGIINRVSADPRLKDYLQRLGSNARVGFMQHGYESVESTLELLGVIKMDSDGHYTIRNRLYREKLGLTPKANSDTQEKIDMPANTALLTPLRQLLVKHFSDGELHTLCFDLGVEYDDLPGQGREAKARELVSHMERRGRLADLVRVGQQSRSDVPWPDIDGPSAPPKPSYTPPDYKRKALEQQLKDQLELYAAAQHQLSYTPGAVQQTQLKRQIAAIEGEIEDLRRKLGQSSDEKLPELAPETDQGDGKTTPLHKTFYGQGNHWAVLVGVNTYEDKGNYGRLHVCVGDVTTIRDRLITGGFDADRIHLLTDDTPDNLPIRAKIINALQVVANATKPDDLLLFYYSGHGDELDGESYLVSRDGHRASLADTGVPVSRIEEIMQKAKARAKVIVLDACHSGVDFEGKKGTAQPLSPEFIKRVYEQAKGIAILASCEQGQVSYEWAEEGCSAFTYYVREALAGKADFLGKGFVSVDDVHKYTLDKLETWATKRSRVQAPTLESKVEGDIILTRQKLSEVG